MATAERPPAKIDGKPNPEYQAWYRARKKLIEAEGVVVPPTLPAQQPAPLSLQCVKLARNKRYVLCADPENKGKMVPVRILARTRPEKFLKKPVRCECTPEGKYQMIR